MDHALARGLIVRLAPQVYCAPSLVDDLATRARAVMALDPSAVLTGRAAAALGWWPDLAVPRVTARTSHRARTPATGIAWVEGLPPPELVVELDGLRLTSAALSVLDLIPELGGTVVDEALRRGAATLEDLHAALALTPGRRGNRERAHILDDSRDEPWSPLERTFQRDFRDLGLPYRHHTNHRVTLPDGTVHPIDVALPELLLGFELDGWEFHKSKEAFERDRDQCLALATLGWQVERIGGDALTHDRAAVMAQVALVVAAREKLFRGTRPAGTRARSRGGGKARLDSPRGTG